MSVGINLTENPTTIRNSQVSFFRGCDGKTEEKEKAKKKVVEHTKTLLKNSKTWEKHGFAVRTFGVGRASRTEIKFAGNFYFLIDTNRVKNLKLVDAPAKVKYLSEPGIVPNTKDLTFHFPVKAAKGKMWEWLEKIKIGIEYKDGTVKEMKLREWYEKKPKKAEAFFLNPKVEGKGKQEIKMTAKNFDELNDKMWWRYGVFITHFGKKRFEGATGVKIVTMPRVVDVKFLDGKDIYKSYKQDEVKSDDLKKEDKGMLKRYHFALPQGPVQILNLGTVRLNLRVEYKNGEMKDLEITCDYKKEKVIKE